MRLPDGGSDAARDRPPCGRASGRRYVGSARYTLEVDARGYAKQLVQDMQRGLAGS